MMRAALKLIFQLNDPYEAARRAAEDLGELRDATAVPALVAALGDPPADVREAVIEALAAVGGTETAG